MSDDPNSASIAREVDLRPFKTKALQAIADFLPATKMSIKSRMLYAVHEAVEDLSDDRLDLLERDRVTLQKENAELRGQLELLTKVDAEVRDIMQTREDRSDVWAQTTEWLARNDTKALAERLAKVEGRLAALERLADTRHDNSENSIADIFEVLKHHASLIAGLGSLPAEVESLQDMLGEKGRVPGALSYATRISQLADLLREIGAFRGWKKVPTAAEAAIADAGGAAFPDPVPTGQAEDMVDVSLMVRADGALARGQRVKLREGAKTVGGSVHPNTKRLWEIVGLAAIDAGAVVQVAMLPWDNADANRPMYWVAADNVLGAVESGRAR